MKRIMLLVAIVACTTAQAQKVEKFGAFKHIGADVNVGTQGIGFDVSTSITNYLDLSLGFNFMPDFKVSGDVDIDPLLPDGAPAFPDDASVDIEGGLGRTTIDLKVSCYPFRKKTFFVAAGLSFGGKKIAKLKGHSDEVERYIAQYPQYRDDIVAAIDRYELNFDDNGDVSGDIRVKAVRPYLGLGFGRLVPKHRVAFRMELGCQFMGKMKIYQNDKEVDLNELLEEGDDDISDLVDKITVYPVLKFALSGRIL